MSEHCCSMYGDKGNRFIHAWKYMYAEHFCSMHGSTWNIFFPCMEINVSCLFHAWVYTEHVCSLHGIIQNMFVPCIENTSTMHEIFKRLNMCQARLF